MAALSGLYTVTNVESGRRLFAQVLSEPGLLGGSLRKMEKEGFGATAGWAGCEDQMWLFVAQEDGAYSICNAGSGRRLFARCDKDMERGFGAIRGHEDAEDQKWMLEGDGHEFELVNAASGRRVFAENGKEGEYGFGATSRLAGARHARWTLERVAEFYTISNAESGRRLFAQVIRDAGMFTREGVEGFGATAGWAGADDQMWVLVPQDAGADTYAIVNVASRRRLFAQCGRDGNHGFGATQGWVGATDQAWRLEPGQDRRSRRRVYSIVNAASDRRIFAQSGKEGEYGFGAFVARDAFQAEARDQLWCLAPVDAAPLDCGHCAHAEDQHVDLVAVAKEVTP